MREPDNLSHYGIKGMKWGVRRKRNSKTGRVESGDSKTARKLKRKRLSQMSNEELRTLNERMQLEQNYKRLTKGSQPGKAFVQDVLRESGKNIATKYVSKAGEGSISAAATVLSQRQQKPPSSEFRSTTSFKFKKKKKP